ncbi:MAG: hypothetical protein A2729_00545 [Candidatus Buchananbacteria bacterium RIFCSPHIGHO2_01_FULL_39_14]|uniref:Uncharacterized protein n=1 Tax=Candidatus Buchananbacteria bacterium RIFCSPHIGHO2_01_FULL_39_14 TaxID=1797532 RepID=A0A1G1XZC3_9BACT|nr:MAG: hypothetical protein A2729_00545 [Candidatus Buchananbacteria bacterium RIFCSPHIGHO2_01_FULL_39_14]OGY48715.1 MAG: hypothetical protein A3D39_04555 [Candidatus Buchananbacteria bacterium RIFCSPHIGHO2_02_FULL_39_17]
MDKNNEEINVKTIKGSIRRMIWSTIWESKQVARLKPLEVILYIGTISISDDEGRFNADSQILKAKIFPRRKNVSPKMIDGMKKSIQREQLIPFYRVDDEEYGYHPNWDKYQSLRNDRRKISKIPPPFGNPENQSPTNYQPDDDKMAPQQNITKPNSSQAKLTEPSISGFKKLFIKDHAL